MRKFVHTAFKTWPQKSLSGSLTVHPRPKIGSFPSPPFYLQSNLLAGRRTIFIQTESTPNNDVSARGHVHLEVRYTDVPGVEISAQPSNITSGLVFNFHGVFIA